MKTLFFLLPLIGGSLGRLSLDAVNLPLNITPLAVNAVEIASEVVDNVYCLSKYVYKFVDANVTALPDLDPDMKQMNFYVWIRCLGYPYEVYEETYKNDSQINPIDFRSYSVLVYVFFHDIGSNGKEDWIKNTTDYYMTHYTTSGQLVMISINYDKFVINKEQAMTNIEPIANNIATFLHWELRRIITPTTRKYFIFFGHGIGALIASRTAQRMAPTFNSNEKMWVLSALDPEPPMDENELQLLPPCYRYSMTINKSVALSVVVIHTSSCSRYPLIQACNNSTNDTLGTLDFYPNGGKTQPGCPELDLSCSRKRAASLFYESLSVSPWGPQSFYSWPCSNFEAFKAGNCSSACETLGCIVMKEAHLGYTGRYYLCTNAHSPYGKGQNQTVPGYCPARSKDEGSDFQSTAF